MENRPPALAEAAVGVLIPPAAREHLLGDLRERYTTTARYLVDAASVVPFIIASRVRRTFDGTLAALEILMLGMATFGLRRLPDASVVAVRWGIPLVVMLLVLTLCDAYAPGASRVECAEVESVFDVRHGAALARAVRDVVLAMACAWLVEVILGRVAGRFRARTLFNGSGIGLLLLGAWRAAWWTMFTPGSHRMSWPMVHGRMNQSRMAQLGLVGVTMPLLRVAWLRLASATWTDGAVGSAAILAAAFVCFRVARVVFARAAPGDSGQGRAAEWQSGRLRWWRRSDVFVMAVPLVADALIPMHTTGAEPSSWSFGLSWVMIAWLLAEMNARALATFEDGLDASASQSR